jgi:hypothetical protein
MNKKEREFKEKVKNYIKKREAEERFPSLQGLLLELDLSEAEIIELAESKEIKRELNMLKLCREDWLLNKLLSEGKNASGIGHILKLEEEGVIIKEPKSRGKVLHIITHGLGEGAEL